MSDPVEALIEMSRGSLTKRRADGRLDFISPLPCPYNYGSLPGTRGGDGDPIDAIVLGPRLPRGARVCLPVVAEIDFIDEGQVDTKLVLSARPLTERERRGLETFFRVYVLAKRVLARLRGRRGLIAFGGLRRVLTR
jgi:inorganic pyrophosphatase